MSRANDGYTYCIGAGVVSASGLRSKVRCVLFVDDDADVRALYVRSLRDAGFLVEEAETLGDAFAAVDRRAPDAVVLDRDLPDGNGFELARAMRAAGSHARILAFTAHCDRAARLESEAVGCDGFLTKAASPATLVEQLVALLAAGSDGQLRRLP